MAYTLYLYKEFESKSGKTIRLEIFEKDFAGASSEIEAMSSTPVFLTSDNMNNEVFLPIIKTSLAINIINTGQIDYTRFFTSDGTKFKVVVKVSGTTEWTGFLTPDSFQQNEVYKSGITLIARDNLGTLSEYDFDITTTFITIRTLINTAMTRISFPYTYEFLIDKLDSAGVNILDGVILCAQFLGKTWQEALDTTLRGIGGQLRYIGGNTYAIFDIGKLKGYGANLTAQTFLIIEKSGVQEIIPAWKSFTMSQDYQLLDNVYDGLISATEYEFAENRGGAATTPYNNYVTPYYNVALSNDWLCSIPMFNPYLYKNIPDEEIYITGTASTSFNILTTKKLSYAKHFPALNDGHDIRIQFKANNYPFYIDRPRGGEYSVYPILEGGYLYTMAVRCNIFYETATTKYVLKQRKWVEYTDYNEYVIFELPQTERSFLEGPVGGPFLDRTAVPQNQDINISISGLSENGLLTIEFYPYTAEIEEAGSLPHTGAGLDYTLHCMKLSDFDISIGNINEEGLESSVIIDANYNLIGSAEVTIGQVPQGQGSRLSYLGGIFTNSNPYYPPMYDFHYTGGTNYHLSELISREIVHHYKTQKTKLSGSVIIDETYSTFPHFGKVWTDGTLFYALNYGSLDFANEVMQVELVEVEAYETEDFTFVEAAIDAGGGTNLGSGDTTFLQWSAAGNATRIYSLDTATEAEQGGAYVVIDKVGMASAKKVALLDLLVDAYTKTESDAKYALVAGDILKPFSTSKLTSTTLLIPQVASTLASGEIGLYALESGFSGETPSGAGSVTSIGLTMPSSFVVSGSPITENGTFVVTIAAGYAIPTTAKQNQWDTAYTNTHNPITLGTANGLSLSTQVLSLGLASASANGALSSTDWNTFNGKATATGGSGYIQNQIASAQTANFWISGKAKMGTLVLPTSATLASGEVGMYTTESGFSGEVPSGAGSVNSVALVSNLTGITVTGSPITTSGTFTLNFATGYQLMLTAESTKLAGIAANANNYIHPTTAGNLHIPTGGIVGQILKNTASGTATWQNEYSYTLTKAGVEAVLTGNITTHTHAYLSDSDSRIANWTAAYNDKINSATFSSSTLTLTQQDTGTVTVSVPTFNQSTTGSAATLTTTRTIWGQNFNGSANVTGALTSVTDITATGKIKTTGTLIIPSTVPSLATAEVGIYALESGFSGEVPGGAGSVTSISMTVPIGLSVTPATITESGTFAISYAADYSIPTNTKQGEWDSAYVLRHNAVTLGTANGLSLATQALSLALATTSLAGAMSSTDKTKLDGISANANNYSLPLAASGTRGGIQIGFSATGASLPLLLSTEKAYITLTKSAIESVLTGALTSHTHAYLSDSDTRIANWTAAYNDKINSATLTSSALTLTQQDGGTVVVNVPTFNQNTTGSAATLTTARAINISVSGINGTAQNFNGSAAITIPVTLATLTRGSYLTGSDYNGGTARTWAVDATTTSTASKVVARDANADIFVRDVNASRKVSGQTLIVPQIVPVGLLSTEMAVYALESGFSGEIPSGAGSMTNITLSLPTGLEVSLDNTNFAQSKQITGEGGTFYTRVTSSYVLPTALQLSNKIESSLIGAANGITPLDSGGKVALQYLPSTLLKYVGVWNASTNTPTLTNPDTTKKGNVYNVSVAGTQFGLTFKLGDWLIYNDSGVPEKSDNSDDVTSVAGKTGAVTLVKADITDATTWDTAYSHSQLTTGNPHSVTAAQVGALPLSAGSGSPLTGTLYGTMADSVSVLASFKNTYAATSGNEIRLSLNFKSTAWGDTEGGQLAFVTDAYWGTADLVYRSANTDGFVGVLERFRISGSTGAATFASSVSGAKGIFATLVLPTSATLASGEVGLYTTESGFVGEVPSGAGSVTSIALTVPTGLAVTGSPITESGTFAITYASGYQMMLTAESTKLAGIAANANNYSLPTATASILGGVKIGSGVTITDGVISVSTDYLATNGKAADSDLLDGHDTAYFQTALTNPVTGTGTSGYLPKFTGASAIGDSPIFTDGTSVCIGGNTPIDTLDVRSDNVPGISIQSTTNTQSSAGRVAFTMARVSAEGSQTGWQFLKNADDSLLLRQLTSNTVTEQMKVSTSGMVSITNELTMGNLRIPKVAPTSPVTGEYYFYVVE